MPKKKTEVAPEATKPPETDSPKQKESGATAFSSDQDLPPELREQITRKSKVWKSDDEVLQVFESVEGPLSITNVLIGFYKIFNETKNRSKLTSKLNGMVARKLLERVQVGVYQLPQ